MVNCPLNSKIPYHVIFLLWSLCLTSIAIAQETTDTVELPEPTSILTSTTGATPTVDSSATPTPSLSSTQQPTTTPTATVTATLSPTTTPTLTSTATVMPTQTPYIIQQIITQPGIVSTRPPIVIVQTQLPLPPSVEIPQSEPVSTTYPSDVFGWTRYESIGLIQVIGSWQLLQNNHASSYAYHQSRTSGGLLRLPFEGEGFRVGFRTQPHGGAFMLKLDGDIVGMFETQAEEPTHRHTREFFVSSDYHVLDIVAMIPTDVSQAVAIDYVDVFNGPPIPITPQPLISATPDHVVLNDIQLIAMPPTLEPTQTPPLETDMTIELLVGSDRNFNAEIDPTEGVSGLSVRVVRSVDNRLLASGFTDNFGFVRLQVRSAGDITAFIPLLGESRQIRRGTSQTSWVIRLDPANVPGLIP